MSSSEGGIRRPGAERYSERNFDAKFSSRLTKRLLTMRNSSIRPVVNSRSLWNTSSKSQSLVVGEEDGVVEEEME